jgi:hypothetical protein
MRQDVYTAWLFITDTTLSGQDVQLKAQELAKCYQNYSCEVPPVATHPSKPALHPVMPITCPLGIGPDDPKSIIDVPVNR